jgi:hypothetical protein
MFPDDMFPDEFFDDEFWPREVTLPPFSDGGGALLLGVE